MNKTYVQQNDSRKAVLLKTEIPDWYWWLYITTRKIGSPVSISTRRNKNTLVVTHNIQLRRKFNIASKLIS